MNALGLLPIKQVSSATYSISNIYSISANSTFDEHFVLDILVDDGHARGVLILDMMEGTLVQINSKAVVIATGGGCRAFRFNTNGGIVTGDGLSMAYRHGVPLRDI